MLPVSSVSSSFFSKIAALVLVLFYATAMPAALAAEPAAAPAQKTAPVQKAALAAKVNINTASADDLAELLTGIGASKAAAIVAYREEHGPFKAVEDLANVKGIGEATLEKNRDRIAL
jgi:competence protein ComEA